MGERSELHRLYIAVDPSKIVRCGWCGSVESEKWVHNQGGTFCSSTCLNAASADTSGRVLCACMFLPILALITIVLVGGLETIVYLILSFVAVSIVGYGYIQGRNATSKVAKDSRKTETLDDISLLKTLLTHVECPNCDGNIDLADVGEDQIYHCGYCGASGIIEIAFTGKR